MQQSVSRRPSVDATLTYSKLQRERREDELLGDDRDRCVGSRDPGSSAGKQMVSGREKAAPPPTFARSQEGSQKPLADATRSLWDTKEAWSITKGTKPDLRVLKIIEELKNSS